MLNKKSTKRNTATDHHAPKRRFINQLEDPQVQGWRSLLAAFLCVYSHLERELLTRGCSISRFQILLHLYFYGPQTQSELGRKLLLTRGNMSMFISRLRRDNLVQSVRTKGSQREKCALTLEGTAFFESLFPGHIKRIKKMVPVLPPDMMNFLRTLSNATCD
jgi:DNA-binding MarR family transcriptional regulator